MPEQNLATLKRNGQTGPATIRRGPRPATTRFVPHRQLDQWPPRAIFERLIGRCLAIEGTRAWESRLASPNTHALYLANELARGPADAFIDDHEFCHVHPFPESSLHLTLPGTLRKHAIEAGWAEPHLLVHTRSVSPNLVMVYAPRDDFELEAVLSLVRASAQFARGV